MVNHTSDKDFVDLEIRIFPGDERAADYPVEIVLGGQQEFQGHLSADILPWTSSGDLVADGQRLFDALFADSGLRSAWAEARGQSPQRRIRLRIDASAPGLHTLPWELLHEGDTMLAANADTPFSCYLAVSEPWGGAVQEHPIRVLGIVSSPTDLEDMYNLAPLDVDVEQAILEKAFFTLDEDEIELSFLDPPVTLERIEEALHQGAHRGAPGYHILHYVGHGAFNRRRGRAALYLQDEEGNADVVRDTAFINMLARQSAQVRPRLIFLAACQSATRSTTDAFLGLGPKLVVAGVPAVVAMQDRVAIKTARKLALSFYRCLAEHGIVDCALNEARSTLLTAGRPDAAMPVLFMRLMSGQLWETEEKGVDLEVAGPQVPPPPEPTPPPEAPGFVGRETELAAFAKELTQSHLAVITGMPGVGKTACAAVLAQRVGDPKKIFWHTFYANAGIGDIIWKLAGFLYWHGQKDMWDTLQRTRLSGGRLPPVRDLLDYLTQMLRQRDYVLCLDNLQFLAQEDAARLDNFIRQLVPQGAGSRQAKTGTAFIVASQVVPTFVSLAQVEPLTGLSVEDTHRLLVARDMALPEELEAQLYARTEGNPQLLTLSIHILRRASDPARVLDRLTEADDIETYLVKQVDAGLSEDERKVMVATAILLGYPGTRDAIETVADRRRVKRLILHLSYQHLLQAQEGEEEKEYTEHAIVRDFYYNVPGRREQRDMHRRAARYYAGEYDYTRKPQDLLKAALHYERAREYERAVELATQDIWALINQGQTHQLRHLLEQFEAHQLSAGLWARVNLALGEIYTLRRESKLARERFDETSSILNTLPDSPETRENRARVCRWMGVLLEYESPAEALEWLQRGLEELGEASVLEQTILHIRIGSVQIGQGNYAAALDALKKGLELLPEGHSHWRAAALNNLGQVYFYQGDIQQGKKFYLRAMDIYQQSSDYWGVVSTRINLGILMKDASDWPNAATQYGQALELAEKLGLTRHRTNLELAFGDLCLKQGEYKVAAQHLSHCIQLTQQHNLHEYRIYAQATLADLRVRQGNWKAAENLLQQTEQLALDLGIKFVLLYIYRDWARVRLGQNRVVDAREYVERAVNLSRELETSSEEGMSLCVLGQVALAEGQTELAMDAFERSLSLLTRDPYEAARTRHQWGLALTAEGNVEQGTALLQEARATFAKLGARRDLAAVEETLAKVQEPSQGLS